MIIDRIIWNADTIKLVTVLILGTIFGAYICWKWWDYGMGDTDDDDDNDLPDEITVEIVKEKPTDPAQSSSSQTVTSALLSTTQAAASDDASGPKEKRAYLPE